MKRVFLSPGLAALALLLWGSSAHAQVGYTATPVYSNGFVVTVPYSTAGLTTTYYPGGAGAAVYPAANATLSGNTFVGGLFDTYGTRPLPSNAPRTFLLATPAAQAASTLGSPAFFGSNLYGNPLGSSNGTLPTYGVTPLSQNWRSQYYPWGR